MIVVVVFSCYFFHSLIWVFTYMIVTSRLFGVRFLTYMKAVGENFICFALFSDWNDLRCGVDSGVWISVQSRGSYKTLEIWKRLSVYRITSANIFSSGIKSTLFDVTHYDDREVFVGFSPLSMAIGFMILCYRHDVESRTGLFRTRSEWYSSPLICGEKAPDTDGTGTWAVVRDIWCELNFHEFVFDTPKFS